MENPFRRPKSILEISQENIFAVVTRSLYVGGSFNYPRREEVFMSLQALCGEASVDDHVRKVASSAHNVGIQRFYFFARLLFHSVYDYVCGAALDCFGSSGSTPHQEEHLYVNSRRGALKDVSCRG